MQAIYISSNQFKVSTDKTSEFLAGRRVRALCGSEYKYSTVQSSTYSSPDTTITIEESILTSNLSEVHYGIVNIGEQGSFPNHSHDGNEGTGGLLSLSNLSDTPDVYEEGKYLRATTSGVEFAVPDDRYYTESEVDTISGSLQTNIDAKPDTEVFLVEGVPSDSIGVMDDIAVNQNVGTVYKKIVDPDQSNSDIFYPVANGDDGVRRGATEFYAAWGDGYLGGSSADPWKFFTRFPNISIPVGATITNAFIRFESYATRSATTCNEDFSFNDVDDAVAPTTYQEFDNLVKTTEKVSWNNIGGWIVNVQYDSIDISSALQEVINRSGWNSGNAVTLIGDGTGSSSTAHRMFYAFDHTIGTCPELHVTWTDPLETFIWGEKLSPDFLKLSDTPTTYSGVSGQYLKTTSSGIEFVEDLYTKSEVDTISGSLQSNIDNMPVTFLELEDTPTTYSGASGKYVKTTYSGIEFSDDYHFGDDTNYTQIEPDGKIHFFGDAQPVNFTVIDSLNCDASHLAPLSMISLAVADGILTSGLDTATGSSRRIEVVGVDGGIYVKGRDKGSYTQGDTTHESYRIKIKLNTTNATWEQSGEWRIILDILSGDITGAFTVYMPPFSIMEYNTLEVYVTVDGATYAETTPRGFDVSVAGPSAAEELFSNNETTGSGIVVEVASTTGFYVGNEVFVSDTSNSEWTRIKEVVIDTSITADLTNSYTTASGAKFNMFDYTKTTLTKSIHRGLFRARIFKANENSGVQLQIPVPQQTDPTKDMDVVLQYVTTADNPVSSLVSKWRVHYFFKTIGEDIPESYQYAELVYADITPPVTKCTYIATLATITPEKHQGKNLLAMQVVRLGTDAGDTYTGNFKLAAIITTMPWKQLGYEA